MRIVACLLSVLFATSAAAQQRGTVSGVVRASTGDSLPGAPVHVTATGVDTTVRANARGRYEIALPFGAATLRATAMGYAARAERITVASASTQLDIVLARAAQQLTGVDVRATWTGVRGGVGDESTRAPLPGVSITSIRQRLNAVTDSNGRFELGMQKGERIVLQLSHTGYRTRAVTLDIAEGQAEDVIYFLKPGRDLPYLKTALNDLAHRVAATQINGFIDGHEHLARHNATNLSEALAESGLLQRKGLKMSTCVFLFVDGQPRPGFPVSSVNMADVDFVEVYYQENTLALDWGKAPCTPNPGVVSTGMWHPANYVSVWMKH